MNPLNAVIIKVDSTTNDHITIKGDQGDVKLMVDTSYKPLVHSRIYGEVVYEPAKIGKLRLGAKHEGSPSPLKYRGHDLLKHTIKGFTTKEKEHYKHIVAYVPASHEPESEFIEQVNIIKPGDRVYFHYLVLTRKQNYINTIDGMHYYIVPFDQLFCVVQEGEIKMLNGNIFVKPAHDENYVEEDGMWVKYSGSIISSVDNKPKYLKGKVCYVGESGDRTKNLWPNQIIYFTPNSEFENEIEGDTYYKMSHNDVVAYEENGIYPLGDWVRVTPEKTQDHVIYDAKAKAQKVKPGQIILLPETEKKKRDVANVIKIGDKVTQVSIGDKVIFNQKIAKEIEGIMFSREGDIMATIYS
jgi:co-chaperonin GroES (HSP10)